MSSRTFGRESLMPLGVVGGGLSGFFFGIGEEYGRATERGRSQMPRGHDQQKVGASLITNGWTLATQRSVRLTTASRNDRAILTLVSSHPIARISTVQCVAGVLRFEPTVTADGYNPAMSERDPPDKRTIPSYLPTSKGSKTEHAKSSENFRREWKVFQHGWGS